MESVVEPIVAESEKPAERSGGFKPGPDPRRVRTYKKPKEYVAPEDDGANAHLMDMRHVYLNVGRFDKTQGQETARQLLKKDPKGFMSQLVALEKEHRANVRAASGAGADGVDVGGEAALSLCEGWLKERL